MKNESTKTRVGCELICLELSLGSFIHPIHTNLHPRQLSPKATFTQGNLTNAAKINRQLQLTNKNYPTSCKGNAHSRQLDKSPIKINQLAPKQLLKGNMHPSNLHPRRLDKFRHRQLQLTNLTSFQENLHPRQSAPKAICTQGNLTDAGMKSDKTTVVLRQLL